MEIITTEHIKTTNQTREENLFGIQNTDREIKWVQSEDVKNDSLIGYHQVVFALSKLINIYSNVKMKEWLDKNKTFNSLLKEDNLGRKYLIYSDYRKWAVANSKKLNLKERQKKEIKLWILGL